MASSAPRAVTKRARQRRATPIRRGGRGGGRVRRQGIAGRRQPRRCCCSKPSPASMHSSVPLLPAPLNFLVAGEWSVEVFFYLPLAWSRLRSTQKRAADDVSRLMLVQNNVFCFSGRRVSFVTSYFVSSNQYLERAADFACLAHGRDGVSHDDSRSLCIASSYPQTEGQQTMPKRLQERGSAPSSTMRMRRTAARTSTRRM